MWDAPQSARYHNIMEQLRRFAATDNAGEVSLAVRSRMATRPGQPGLVWLGGFRSDMTGTKAEAMIALAQDLGAASLRFDYSGHGESGGRFVDGTISAWVQQCLALVRTFSEGPQVLVGSSMGAWIALRLVQELQNIGEQDRIGGLVLIAPAPDFISELIIPALTAEQKTELEATDQIVQPSAYCDEPTIITRALLDDGMRNRVLDGELTIGAPVHIIQGREDPDVPWQHAQRLCTHLAQDNVTLTMVRDGDHRLSRDEDIALISRSVRRFMIP